MLNCNLQPSGRGALTCGARRQRHHVKVYVGRLKLVVLQERQLGSTPLLQAHHGGIDRPEVVPAAKVGVRHQQAHVQLVPGVGSGGPRARAGRSAAAFAAIAIAIAVAAAAAPYADATASIRGRLVALWFDARR